MMMRAKGSQENRQFRIRAISVQLSGKELNIWDRSDRRPLTADSLFFRGFHFLQHLKNKPDRPFGRSAVQGQGNSGGLQDFFPAGSKVSSTADVEFDSAVTLLRDADAQSNELFVFTGQGAVLQRIGFQIFELAKHSYPAAEHGLIVLLAGFSYFTDLIEHRSLLDKISLG